MKTSNRIPAKIGNLNIPVIIFLLLVGFLTNACSALSGPEPYRVGIVTSLPAFNPIADGFKAEMEELGYVEGENIVYDFQEGNDDPAVLKPIIDQFVADEVDMIFAYPTGAAIAAQAGTAGTDIPVVFASAQLEGTDLIADIREPGGNATGIRFPGPELTVLRLEYLVEIAPDAKRILLLHDPGYAASAAALEAMEAVVPDMGIELVVEPIGSVEDVSTGLQNHEINGETDIDAILIMPEGYSQSPDGWGAISAFAAKHQIPVGGSAAFEADTGAVFSHIPDSYETGVLVAPTADKILEGEIAPGTIPVLTPDSHLRINLTKAESLGLVVSERLLRTAEEVIRE